MTVFKGQGTGRFSDPESSHGSLDFPALHTGVILYPPIEQAEQILDG